MSTENVSAQEPTPPQPPTKEEIIAFFKEQIEVKKYQAELQDLNTRLAVGRAEEMKALSFIGQMTNPQAKGSEYQGGTPHTITQEDLDANPELVEAGVQVGDEVIIPSEPAATEKKERNLKKK